MEDRRIELLTRRLDLLEGRIRDLMGKWNGLDVTVNRISAKTLVADSITGESIRFADQNANKFLGGPVSGGDATPTFRALVDADVPSGVMRDAEHAADAHAMTIDGVDVSAHAVANTGVHGIGASTFATAATLATHAALQASVHGISITAGKTLTVQNSLTLTGTDGKGLTLTGGLTIGANTSITGGGTLALGGYTLTVPATGTGVITTRTITSGAGLTGGGDLSADRTLEVGAGTGITVNANDVAVNTSYAFTWAGAHTFNAGATIAAGQNLAFGADVSLARKNANLLALATGDSFQSVIYTPGVAGWTIGADGNAEFANVRVRGAIQASVFEKSVVSAFAGSLIVSKSAGKIETSWVVDNGSVPFANTAHLIIEANPGTEGWLFETNDIVRIKAEYSGGVGDTWGTVTRTATMNEYDVTINYGTVNVAWPAGTAVIDYGPSGSGYFGVSADGTYGASAAWVLASHAGSPWSTVTPQVYAGTDGKLYAGAGKVALDSAGITLVDQAGVIYYGSNRFLHILASSGVAGEENFFIGNLAGNRTMGAAAVYNLGIGYDALNDLTSGTYNIAVGAEALRLNTSGNNNIALGVHALGANTTGSYNIALGLFALYSCDGGLDNVAVGGNALHGATSGQSNTALGSAALYSVTTVSGCVALGKSAGYHETEGNKLYIDNAARASEADGRIKALIYGVFAAASADQRLTFNAGIVAVNGGIHIGGTSDPGNDNLIVDGTATIAGTSGNILVCDTNVLVVDATNNRVGICKDNPAVALDVNGNINASGNVGYSGALVANKNSTTYSGYAFVPLTAQLTSTSWDGDSYSTTSKTLIDLSVVFGVPAGVKAILVGVGIRDSGSSTGESMLILSPNSNTNEGAVMRSKGLPNDYWMNQTVVVPCDANGDIYYQITATGAGTLDVYLQIWGYWI